MNAFVHHSAASTHTHKWRRRRRRYGDADDGGSAGTSRHEKGNERGGGKETNTQRHGHQSGKEEMVSTRGVIHRRQRHSRLVVITRPGTTSSKQGKIQEHWQEETELTQATTKRKEKENTTTHLHAARLSAGLLCPQRWAPFGAHLVETDAISFCASLPRQEAASLKKCKSERATRARNVCVDTTLSLQEPKHTHTQSAPQPWY